MSAVTDDEVITIPDLEITFDEVFGHINLKQSNGIDGDALITLHPIQLRLMAEQAGLVQTSDPVAAKVIARLTRQLCQLRNDISYLFTYMSMKDGDNDYRDDLVYEIGLLEKADALAEEYCTDLPGVTPLPRWANCYNRDEPTKEGGNTPKPTQTPIKTQAKPTAKPPETQHKPVPKPIRPDAGGEQTAQLPLGED